MRTGNETDLLAQPDQFPPGSQDLEHLHDQRQVVVSATDVLYLERERERERERGERGDAMMLVLPDIWP